MITEDYDDLFDRIRGNLGEHFSNYMFIVMDDEGDLFYDYTNHRVGRMLVEETKKEMDTETLDVLWEEEELSDDAYSMVWDRTYSATDPTEKECEILAGALDVLGVSHMIVGHTVQEVINPACDGMVWRIDVGMTAYYGGTTQVLQIQDGQFEVLQNI